MEAPALPDISEVKNRIEKSYEIRVITPVYGGGAVAGESDPVLPVRPTAIRGHLRFWWRATRGAGFADAAELYKAESAIWGNTEKASPVNVEVQADSLIRPLRRHNAEKPFDFPKYGTEAYVLFPVAGDPQNKHNLLKEGFSFTLTLSWDAKQVDEVDVQCALWAWLNFGGIGARTRRGLGALFCRDFAPPEIDRLPQWFAESLKNYEIPQHRIQKEWACLGSCWAGKTSQDALKAWGAAVEPMRAFRQGKKLGRNEGQQTGRPGRSRWPEPDTLRVLQNKKGHAPDPDKPQEAFPRSAFGLPIIFHFIGSGEPADSEVLPVHRGEVKQRMASPIILKPLATLKGFCPCVVRMLVPPLSGVQIKEKAWGEGAVINEKFAAYPNSPLAKRSPSGSAIEGFLAYLKEQQFEEVFR